jgi:hypothetical protein
MKTIRTALAAVCLLALGGVAGAQTVQTFEDFSPCNDVPGNVGLYGPVNYLFQFTCFSFTQATFNAHSGTARVFANLGNDNASSGSFTFAPMQFLGAWFAGGSNVSFQLFFAGNQVATSSSLAVGSTPAFLASGYSGLVDRVRVVGTDDQWVMDDVTFNTVSVAPEPASAALVASGLVVIGAAGFRRRKRG